MRILVLADIHGNIEALRAVLRRAGRFDEVVVAGDLVDYGPAPGEVIDEIRSLAPALWVRGNHDQYIARRPRCWGAQGLRAAARATRVSITRRRLSPGDLRALGERPGIAAAELDGSRIVVVHASPRSPLCGGIYPWYTEERVSRALSPASRLMEADYVVAAHTHIPMATRVAGSIILLNPGSVGQPRDGDPRASYAIIDTEKGAIHGRAAYNVDRTVARLKDFNLEPGVLRVLEQTLRTGRAPKPLY